MLSKSVSFTLFFLILRLLSWGQLTHIEVQKNHFTISEFQKNKIDSTISDVINQAPKDPRKAIDRLKEIAKRCDEKQYGLGAVKAMTGCGNIYINVLKEEDATPAIGYLRAARLLMKKYNITHSRTVSNWNISMGAAFAKISQMDSAMYYMLIALNIDLKEQPKLEQDKLRLVRNYINLQAIYFEMNQFEKVDYYGNLAFQIASDNKFYKDLYTITIIAAGALVELAKPELALQRLSRLDTINYIPSDYDIKKINEIKGYSFLRLSQPEKAIVYFKKAIKANDSPSPSSYRGLGKSYYLLGKLSLAQKELEKARDMMLEVKSSNSFLAQTYFDLAKVYDSMGAYRAAYENQVQGDIIQRMVDDTAKLEVVNKLENQFQRAEQEKKLAENKLLLANAKQRLSSQRLWSIGITLLSLFLIALTIVFYQKQKIQRQKNEGILQHQEIKNLKTAVESEERERSRIGRELHDDIMVQLSIVKMNIEALPSQMPAIESVSDYNSIKEQLRIASRDLRLTAHNLAPDTLLADGLLQALVYFFKNVQYRSKLIINFQNYGTPYELPQETEINIYRIAQELTQNIIKHAHAKNVLIQLNYRPQMLTLTIEDDGIGFDFNGPSANAGVGLKSIRSRLKIINGEMDIHCRTPKGTSVTIEVYI